MAIPDEVCIDLQKSLRASSIKIHQYFGHQVMGNLAQFTNGVIQLIN
jgi:hypothetical protein